MAEMFLRQELKLQQKLVMTQELQLAIKLLQMNRMEITTEIQQQLMENPCLEEDTSVEIQAMAEPLQSRSEERKPSLDEIEQVAKVPEPLKNDTKQGEGEAAESQQQEIDWDRFVDNYESFRDGSSRVRPAEEAPSYENFVTQATTLQEHLEWQLRLTDCDELQSSVCHEIIGNLDEHGYLRNDDSDDLIEGIAKSSGVPLDYVLHCLSIVQGFEPLGIAARDLSECLLIQAKSFYPDEPNLIALIANHIDDLELRRAKVILRTLRISETEFSRLMELLATLEPKPGRAFGGQHNPFITPDVYVHKIEDDFVVELNDQGLTRLKVSNHYKSGLRGQNKDTQEFIKKRLSSAMWFIKSIEQRQQTIRKVSESIVRYQRDFFERGAEHLRPLVLRDIAMDIGMHESTVSRVTSNKYMHTPQGIFPMKFFFNSRIESAGGGDLASEAVKRKIRRYIEEEDNKKPLSDQGIADLLDRDEGIQIARRTVAKYREQMGISSSSQRKGLF